VMGAPEVGVAFAPGVWASSVTCAKLGAPNATRTKMKIHDFGFGQKWEAVSWAARRLI
jgi:hypothetical protein